MFQKHGGAIDELGPVVSGEGKFESKSTEGVKRDSSSDEEGGAVAEQGVAVEAPVGINDGDREGQIENDERAVDGLGRPRNLRQGRSKSKYPKAHDKISCLLGEGDQAECLDLVVIKKGGKATARNKDYFNVKYSDNSTGGIHLDQVPWRHQPGVNRQGDCEGEEQIEPVLQGGGDREDETGEGALQPQTVEDGEVQQELPSTAEEADEVYVVTIPRNLHNTKPVLEAKRKELVDRIG